ncbi:cyanocobalamin reductase / alkylcobalamin dealkylase-like [Daphnia carinata]|uniref:cyanocobalamin reductase / alkylcobalamin dealkylase-like n=1 Tax=Daphnia carinata TaxID=120202 RepID=UPI00257B05A4|nr:cyanocobalamin reductase / alkylcobalamin dealkylase-like [Daphnia carinata]
MDTLSELRAKLAGLLHESGLECHPFKVGWYNANVKPGFQLEHPDDTLAFIIISSPSFFEKCFIPYVRNSIGNSINQDYLDQALRSCLTRAIQSFPDQKTSVLYDYEMRQGTRRPKVLVQTAGHVSGAVYFYQKTDILDPPWPVDKAIYGVCLHPKYIGWFALRAVIIFQNVLVPNLDFKPPKDILEEEGKKIDLLNRYNNNWQDWSFRDVVKPAERYSELQQKYFSTRPSERSDLIEFIRTN